MKDLDAMLVTRRTIVAAAPLAPLVTINAAPAEIPTLSPSQMRLLNAVIDRLIPADELGPGARECGVAVYIDRSLAGPLARETAAFTAALDATEIAARQQHGAPFADLDDAAKDKLLTAMEQNRVSGFTPDSRTFFNRIRQLALEGMFGDPFYGGNRAFAGWDLIRYPGPRLAAAPADQNIREPIKPLRTSAHGARHGD